MRQRRRRLAQKAQDTDARRRGARSAVTNVLGDGRLADFGLGCYDETPCDNGSE
jgi:hypothetical protein